MLGAGQQTPSSNTSNTETKFLKVASLNVCGLRRRAEIPELLEFVNDYDLILFSETKVDDTVVILFPRFSCFAQPSHSKTNQYDFLTLLNKGKQCKMKYFNTLTLIISPD